MSVEITPKASIDQLEALVLQAPQVDLRTEHRLSGGVYARTVHIPAGTVVTGATHKKGHINVLFGDITVATDEGPVRFTGYHVLPGTAGTRRAVIAHADTVWTTLCETELTDIAAIEDELVVESHRLQTRQQALGATSLEKLEE